MESEGLAAATTGSALSSAFATEGSATRPRLARLTPVLVAAVGFAGYAGWALLRHAEFQTGGYDLGIFEQAVRSYTEGRSPVSDLIAPGYLLPGDHFHPILVVLVPFYALWRGPETLLVVQSLLLATSAIPVTRCAIRQLGQRCGTVTGVGYVLSYGLLTAASFDFHEICFAVPLVALCGEHLLSGRWNAAVLCALPLILVKEDLPVTVAAVGVYLVLKRRLVLGSMTVLVGIGTSALVVLVVLPALSASGHYAFGDKFDAAALGAGLLTKAVTLLVLLAPTALLAVCSPLAILALPTLAWRFASSDTLYWQTGFHYDAVLVPIIFLAALDGLGRLRARARLPVITSGLVPVCASAMAAWSVLHLVPKVPQPLWTSAQIRLVNDALARVPDGVLVAASNRLAPHLTNRDTVMLFPLSDRTRLPEWIVAAKPFVPWPAPAAQQQQQLTHLADDGYRVVVDDGVVEVLRRAG